VRSPALARVLPLALAVVACACAGCGSAATAVKPAEPREGGTLRVVVSQPVLWPDPHRFASAAEASVHAAVYRQLYAWPPAATGEVAEPVPDLADGAPRVSRDGRTIVVGIRDDVRFTAGGRRLTAYDVEHGIERALGDRVVGGSARQALGALAGLTRTPRGWRDVPGVRARDARTLVLRLRRADAAPVVAALATSLSTPVPVEVDPRPGPLPETPSAFTGPYVPVASGRRDGPQGPLVLVRNPAYRSVEGDWRAAYAERIVVRDAGEDAERAVLIGQGLVLGDPVESGALARRAAKRRTEQVVTLPLALTHHVALNHRRPPLDDVDVRKAIGAAVDRQALLEAAGGQGEQASHWLPPSVAGYEESGGAEGRRHPWLAAPEGDLDVARRYLRRAGHRAGRYEGRPLVALSGRGPSERAVTRALRRRLAAIGIRLQVRFAAPEVVERGCRAPAMRVDVCPDAVLSTPVRDPAALLRAGLEAWVPLDRGLQDAVEAADRWVAPEVEDGSVTLPAGALTEPEDAAAQDERAWRWAAVNDALLEQMPGVPWAWGERTLLVARDVRAVANERLAAWELSATALEEGGR